METIRKKALPIFIAMTLILAFFIPSFELIKASATDPVRVVITKEKQLVDTMTFDGHTIKAIYHPLNDDNYGDSWGDPVYCCAALVAKFYNTVYNTTVYNLYPGNLPLASKGSFKEISPSQVQVGDIYGNSTHWAIVKKISGNTITLFEQNWTWYDSNGTYAMYNRSVNKANLASDDKFYRYSEADIPNIASVTAPYATYAGDNVKISWSTNSKTVKSTLRIYKYSSKGVYSNDNIVETIYNIKAKEKSLKLPAGTYVAMVRNISKTGKYTSSAYKKFFVVSKPLATSVKLGATQVTLNIGNKKSITSKMTPLNTKDILTWTSSDASIASVSNTGVVTAKKAGVVTIKASAVSKKYASCKVVVKPSQVSNFKAASKTTNSITLSWLPVVGATQYRIYKYYPDKKKYGRIAILDKTKLKISDLKSGEMYKYKILAGKKIGESYIFGDYSDPIEVVTSIVAPKNLKVTGVSASTVVLSWDKVSNISGYSILVKTEGSSTYKELAEPKKTETTYRLASKIASGTGFTVAIKSYKLIDGKKYYSASSNKEIASSKPNKVKITETVSPKKGTAVVKWQEVKNADSYSIYKYDSKTKKFYFYKNVSAKYLKATVTSLTTNQTYDFKVRALKNYNDKVYYGNFSDIVSVKVI